MAETRRGFLFGVAAYGMWGLFTLYWPLLQPAGAAEILSHRVVWLLVVMAVLVLVVRRGPQLRRAIATPRTRNLLTLASVVIAVNWGVYIWGVNNGHVVETSLGYFINPLVTVLMGVVVLGERLRRLQWIALGLVTAAVLGLTIAYGRPPWIALVLAFSFGTYGLAKKQANVGAVESLTVETAMLTPIALGYLGWLASQGATEFGHHGTGHTLLMLGAGVVTAVPLICFGAAATRVSLTTIGLLQYLTPTIQFVIGVFVFHEPMPVLRWVGFALVWAALAVFTIETLNHHRRYLRLATEASAL